MEHKVRLTFLSMYRRFNAMCFVVQVIRCADRQELASCGEKKLFWKSFLPLEVAAI
jgi:hypothetical protein